MTATQDTLMRAGAKLAARAQHRAEDTRVAMEGLAIILLAAEDIDRHGRDEGDEAKREAVHACAA